VGKLRNKQSPLVKFSTGLEKEVGRSAVQQEIKLCKRNRGDTERIGTGGKGKMGGKVGGGFGPKKKEKKEFAFKDSRPKGEGL